MLFMRESSYTAFNAS